MILSKKYSIYFVDFFDTIMFRCIHPSQVKERWAALVINKYKSLSQLNIDKLLQYLVEAKQEYREFHHECVYDCVIRKLYQKLCEICPELSEESPTSTEFAKQCMDMECAVEYGVQYPNMRLLKFLNEEAKQGKKIYIVSDFYLGKKELIKFLQANNIDCSIFTDIFVSSDYDATKAEGTLYHTVLKKISSGGNRVLMIGDNRKSDGSMAKASGLHAHIMMNRRVKIRNQLSKRFHFDYSKTAYRMIRNNCYKYNSPFSEYAIIFYLFTKKLHHKTSDYDIHCITFLAREGQYLKRLFEMYQQLLIPAQNNVATEYFKCSRRAILTVQPEKIAVSIPDRISFANYLKTHGFIKSEIEKIADQYALNKEDLCEAIELGNSEIHQKIISDSDFQELIRTREQESINAFRLYCSQYIHNNEIHIVDVGWRGSMQLGIEDFTHAYCHGYYLGLIASDFDSLPIDRDAIIFHEGRSKYSHILRANIQLYELLLAANHGSAQRYAIDGKKVVVAEEWADNEHELYQRTIKNKQEEMILIHMGLCAWCDDFDIDKSLDIAAKTVLKSALFANTDRLNTLAEMDKGFIWGFGQEEKGLSFNKKGIKINWKWIIHPDQYIRYYAKIQRTIKNNKILSLIYWPIAGCLYAHTLFVSLFVNRWSKQKWSSR